MLTVTRQKTPNVSKIWTVLSFYVQAIPVHSLNVGISCACYILRAEQINAKNMKYVVVEVVSLPTLHATKLLANHVVQCIACQVKYVAMNLVEYVRPQEDSAQHSSVSRKTTASSC